MHRRNEGLDYSKCRRDVPALVSAVQAYFGSWGKALHQAGIDPNLYFVRHKWRKSK
jgi:crotonobetainyl-CoA:carnitine CoA-transferase CaiB-like acyl-CoA transferase